MSGMAGDDFPELLSGARHGDGAACTELYRRYGPGILGYLRARGVREPDDVASEVLVRVFRTIGTFRGDESRFRSWIFTIAHYAAIDEHRRAQRRPVVTTLDAAAGVPGGDVEDDVLSRLARERVDGLLATLSTDQRDVLLLRVVADCSIEQTAAVLGKSYEAVKALQRRALRALRKEITREGVPR
jgi:RNA polymerase sigma-70 factor (ECF subfamily)